MRPSKETRREEGRGGPEGHSGESDQGRTQSRIPLQSRLARVHAAARSAARTRFTALLHHIDQEALGRAFDRQQRRAAAGVDGITVDVYAQNLAANLQDLHRHFPSGSIKKEGPSAGIAIACTSLGCLLQKAAPVDFALTCEMTVVGGVLPL